MPLVQAKCPNCGASLEVDNTKDAAVCPYCQSAYIVEKAIQQFITQNIIITEHESALKCIERGILQIRLKQYKDARLTFESMTKEFPEDWRSWFGLAIINNYFEVKYDWFGKPNEKFINISDYSILFPDGFFSNCSEVIIYNENRLKQRLEAHKEMYKGLEDGVKEKIQMAKNEKKLAYIQEDYIRYENLIKELEKELEELPIQAKQGEEKIIKLETEETKPLEYYLQILEQFAK